MEQDTEYMKLPLEERCVHKSWRARLHGYEECVKTFQCIDDEKSSEWNKFLGFVKKFVADSNAAAQEKGLEAVLALVENAAVAGKTVNEVMGGIVTKCIAAPKAKTKELSVQITLMYIEIEKHEAVQEELLKGTEAKNPKIVAACIAALTLSLREFGPKVINIKPLIKKIPALLEDRDKIIRDEGKAMVIEIYRWIGPSLKQQLNSLKPVHIAELETEFNNVKAEKVVPTRFLKSQKPKAVCVSNLESDNSEECKDDDEENLAEDIDPYELLDPVDILSKLPKDFFEKLEAKKWQERKEALEVLENLVKNPKLESGDYNDLVKALKKIILKDTNVLVVALAGKCLAGLASGLKKQFQPYAVACLSAILEKFREKKQNVVQALREAADAIFLTVSIDLILDDSLAALENKNPAVKAETAAYLTRCFACTDPASMNKKLLKAYSAILLKTLNEPDPTVRDTAAEALGTAMKLVGEKVMMPFLTDTDNLKMTKIKECAEKAVIVVKISAVKKPTDRPKTAPAKVCSAKSKESESKLNKRPNTSTNKKTAASKKLGNTRSQSEKTNEGADEMAAHCLSDERNGEMAMPTRGMKSKSVKSDNDYDIPSDENISGIQMDMNDRIDISNQITESLLNELSDKNWKVRNEGLQKITALLNEAKYIKGSIGDLPQGLALRLVDSNSKIAQSSLNVCQMLAVAMGPPAKQHIRTVFPGFLQCLGDSKSWIRTTAISCINTWGDQCGYKEFFDSEMISDALKAGSPVLRAELWNWLSEKLPLISPKQIPKEELFLCIPYLYSNLEDRNSDVRKNAQEAVLGFMIHLSYERMARNIEKLKPGSRIVVLAALDKSRPNLPVQVLPKKSALEEVTQKTVKSGGAMKAAKAGSKSKGSASSKPSSARKKDEDVDTSPLLSTNNLKHQRVIDEQKLKVLKWNFTTPRPEFVELLKELMTAANVNKTLMANMFHSDFRYHLKAIEALTEDLPGNSKALVSNLDLILKWLTLRFFDTNPSVLLKGLDYLQSVFNLLIEDQYHMLENEAASFIPYLIIKIGDPKDAVRNGVRALFKQIALVYPISKLFSYVMEGLKSKNARQRTECLDQLGSLIENYGVSVCQPSPSTALKEVAKQIADRDNSVRNAALNCIVQAYFLEGERVLKLIGQISEKDQSLLDERIKRAAKNRPVKSSSTSRMVAPTNSVSAASTEDDEVEYEEENDEGPTDVQEEVTSVVATVQTHSRATIFRSQKSEESEITSTEFHGASLPGKHEINKDHGTRENDIPNHPLSSNSEDTAKTLTPTSMQTKISGPFGLDMDFLRRIESSAPATCRIPVLLETGINDLDTTSPFNAPKTQVIPISPPKLLVSKSALTPLSQIMTKEDSTERNILGMSSLDLQTAIQSMSSIENLLKSRQVSLLQIEEDKLINAVNTQLKLLQTYPLHYESVDVSKGFRNAFLVILSFYDTGILGKNVSLLNLKDLVDEMITLLAETKLDRLHQADAYYRVINIIVVKIIDNSNHTTIICALIKLLHACAESSPSPKYEELVMKCLWKIVKTIPNWAADLDYDTILLEVHRFFKDYPTIWWKKHKSDTPVRTIKTVVHSMTRVKGSTILSHLTLINNTNESELHSYLTRLIATFKPDEINIVSRVPSKTSNTGRTQKHLSKFTHQQLSEIFKKIGSKHHMQEGLVQLYDFKLQYPEADVQPFLVKSHQFFQDFIEQGLRDIDKARKSQTLISQSSNEYVNENAESSETIAEEKNLIDLIDPA